MSDHEPCISVLIATYNRADMIGRAICSVLSQTFEDFELIIVSDGSTDATAEVVKSFDDPRIVFVDSPANRGFPAARNAGIRLSRGQYLAFLDDDDEWLPCKLERQLAVFRAARVEVGLVYCWAEWRNGRGEKIREKKPQVRGEAFPAMLFQQALGPPSSVMIRREVVDHVGYLDTVHAYGEDRNYYMRICKSFEVDFLPEVAVRIYRDHKQMTQQTADQARSLIAAIERRLDLFGEEFRQVPEAQVQVLGGLLLQYLNANCWADAGRSLWRILGCRAALAIRVRVMASCVYCWLWHLQKRIRERRFSQLSHLHASPAE